MVIQIFSFVYYLHFSFVIFNQQYSMFKEDKQIHFVTFIHSKERLEGGNDWIFQ